MILTKAINYLMVCNLNRASNNLEPDTLRDNQVILQVSLVILRVSRVIQRPSKFIILLLTTDPDQQWPQD